MILRATYLSRSFNTRIHTSIRMASTGPAKQPAIPRPSASLVVVNANNEVLLVHRHPKSTAFAGAHVFPGGNLDSSQDMSPKLTAIRETFEETGILFASGDVPAESVLDMARKDIHSRNMTFATFTDKYKLKANVAALLPFTSWITPVTSPKRFHTHFYLTFLTDARAVEKDNGTHRLPTSDGGIEVVSTRYIKPAEALRMCQANEIFLMPPQYYILSTLADVLPLHDARSRLEALSSSAFGSMLITPRALAEKDSEGRTILTYEGDEARGGKPGRLHRSLVKFGQGGVTTQIILQRNFDVFTELNATDHTLQAKL